MALSSDTVIIGKDADLYVALCSKFDIASELFLECADADEDGAAYTEQCARDATRAGAGTVDSGCKVRQDRVSGVSPARCAILRSSVVRC